MRVRLITPSPPGQWDGNRVTARRWARLFRELGHRADISRCYRGERCDLLVALHAYKSHHSIRRFTEASPRRPLVVVLAGTDLYRDLHKREEVESSLELATHLVVLQKQALVELPARFRGKTSVIHQSARPVKGNPAPPRTYFRVCVVGNLRREKDPFRTARASRLLPAASRIRIVHVGAALDEKLGERARAENKKNPRYRWIGFQPYWKTRRDIAGSHLLALTSLMEGSSNVLSEALASSVPVVASRIAGLVGTLGEDYPGFFPVCDTRALAALLHRAETEAGFYRELEARCRRLSRLVRPEREKRCWEKLLGKICSQVNRKIV